MEPIARVDQPAAQVTTRGMLGSWAAGASAYGVAYLAVNAGLSLAGRTPGTVVSAEAMGAGIACAMVAARTLRGRPLLAGLPPLLMMSAALVLVLRGHGQPHGTAEDWLIPPLRGFATGASVLVFMLRRVF